MDNDLKIIKKKYGEDMMHLCRKLFPTILEHKGMLASILLSHFHKSHSLYQDIIKNNLQEEFKNFIYGLVTIKQAPSILVDKTAQELLKEAGYSLYEAKSEEEIQSFKKYYAPKEELCTFNGERLKSNYVFFAVKDNIDEIRREDFLTPERQDEYGTSILSIQFSRNDSHTLSIKNRYNHMVVDPDSTFSNNLDNIIPGLTIAFANDYGMHQKHINGKFHIPGYVKANDGKFYKYNYELDNIYYCPDNIVIKNFEVTKYDKEKYVLLDYFLLDLQNKTLKSYDIREEDTFTDTIKNIKKIMITNIGTNKRIEIITDRGLVIILLNQNNQIIGLSNPYLTSLDNWFMHANKTLLALEVPFVKTIKNSVLEENDALVSLALPSVVEIGNNFLYYNRILNNLELPKVKQIGSGFLAGNQVLTSISLPKVESIGNEFIWTNRNLKALSLEKVREIGSNCLAYAEKLETIFTPNLKYLGKYGNSLLEECLNNNKENLLKKVRKLEHN